MKKIIALFLTIIMLFTMMPISTFAAESNSAKIIFDSAQALPGKEFTVDLKLINNPGIISANINIAFDEALTLIGAENGSVFPTTMSFIPPKQLSTVGEIKGSCNFAWQSADIDAKDIADGIILSLKFKAADDVSIGDIYNITISARKSDIVDKDMNIIDLPRFTSTVEIKADERIPNSIDDFTYELVDGGIVITGYRGSKTDVIIADSYEIDGIEYSVAEIGESSFEANETITSIVIPKTAKTIGEYAFYDCTSLTEVRILSKDAVIGDKALGYYYISRKEDGTTEGFTIYGYKDSTAQNYALSEDNFTFVILNEEQGCQHSGGTATCIAKAICEKCGEEYGELNVNNHTNVIIDSAVSSTCTSKGLTEGSHCEDCSTVIVAQQTTEMLPHTEGNLKIENENPATCQSKGSYDEVIYCSVCEKELIRITKNTDKLPHNEVSIGEAKEATCIEDGITAGIKCSVCNTVIEEQQVIKAHGHKWDNGTITVPANCVDEGEKTFRCTVENCNGTKTEPIAVEANAHKTIVADEAIPASCTSKGLTEGSHCSACGKVIVAQQETDIIPHTEGEAVKENEQPATCKAEGAYEEVVYCTVCHTELSRVTKKTEKLQHSKVTVGAKPATCKEKGYTGDVVCSVCGDTLSMGTFIEKIPHTEKTVGAKPATCKEEGYTGDVVCAVCNETIAVGSVIEKLPHTPVSADNAVSAACETTGKESDIICSVCKEILESGKEIPALGHKGGTATCSSKAVCETCGKEYGDVNADNHANIVTDKAVAATCKSTGLTEGSHCADCGKVIIVQEEIAKLEHIPVSANNAVEPKCEIEGKESDTICSVCGEILALGKTIPALEHKWTEVSRTEATCEADGLIAYICGNDSTHTKTDVIPATGHTDENNDGICDICKNNICKHENTSIVYAKDASCTESGYTGDKVCNKCGAVLEKGTEIAMLDHTVVIDKGFAATCTNNGLTEGSHCAVCKTIIKEQEVIEAKGHTEVIIPGKEATCTETGFTEGKRCSVCNAIIVKPITTEKLAHEIVIDKAVASTCTNDGLTEGSHCKNCNTVLVAQKTVPAAGHNFSEWTVVAEATCSSDGKETRECSECGTTEVNKIPMTGFVDADGDGYCDECGVSKKDHTVAGIDQSIIVKVKKIFCMILKILETVFDVLDTANFGNGPYKEMLNQVKTLQKEFGCE